MTKVGDRQACLGVKWYAMLIYHLLVELKFSFPYWKVSSDYQDNQNDLLPLTSAQVLCGNCFFCGVFFPSHLKRVQILLSKAVDNWLELQKALTVTHLISEKAKYYV